MDSGELINVDNEHVPNTPAHHHRCPAIPHKESSPALLEVRDLEVSVNGFSVVREISLDVKRGDVIGIIGPNGAGKSTLLRGILGLLPRTTGTVTFEGLDITPLPPFAVAKRGVSLMLQGARLAPRLTVQDAVDLCWKDGSSSPEGSTVWEDLQSTQDLYLRFPAVSRRRFVHAGVLSAGEQQLLALMMSIARRPKLLLLDEPSVGLHPVVLRELFQWLGKLASRGLGLVVVEQHVEALSTIATQMVTVENGRAVSRTIQ
jgi:branched-chain amino acid transport system ATP-binding protein